MASPENNPANESTDSWKQAKPATDGIASSAIIPPEDRRKLLEAVQKTIGWVVDFRKSFSSGNPVLDRFEVKRELGAGAFGQVFLVNDQLEGSLTFGKDIAIKLLKIAPQDSIAQGIDSVDQCWFNNRLKLIENWINEIHRHSVLTKVERDGLVPVLEAAIPGSKNLDDILEHLQHQPIWFSMPVMKQTLTKYVIENSGKLSPFDSRRIMLSVADSLQKLHDFKAENEREQEIVHRDLKPGNILMDAAGKPHVADFGLAIGRHEQLLAGNPKSGTRSFMAPEQYKGQEATQRTDIWAWGVIFYELLSGAFRSWGGKKNWRKKS